MIPVPRKRKPKNFDKLVREPGVKFLERVPEPAQKQWKDHDYWIKVIEYMRKAYKGVCSYSALWISPVTGTHTIDHFKPKSLYPRLAYEWENFRYVSLRYNNAKGTKTIIDPFTLKPGWFVMEFPSLQVKPSPDLSPSDAEAVRQTIRVLKLDKSARYREACQDYVINYCNGDISFQHLIKRAPFIASELKRQGLVERIADIIKYPKAKKQYVKK